MTAHDLFTKALAHMSHTGSSWLSDFMQLWLEPDARIQCWFSGENEQVRVWAFQVGEQDVSKFKDAIPEAVWKQTQEWQHGTVIMFKVTVDKV